MTQQYREKQQQLSALDPEGRAPLAKAQMEMLCKVVDDFLVQLGPVEPGSLPSCKFNNSEEHFVESSTLCIVHSAASFSPDQAFMKTFA